MFQNWGKGWTGYKPRTLKTPKDPRKKFTPYWNRVKTRDTFYFKFFRVEGLSRYKAFGTI